ncbi:MFS general substrate transporter [Roridomyces roridus]|uniref:MFS general substrate transporter n=1 Tax=Roridomyces roridus TaxID=1738132 RepID=A0AAD7FXC0_9AGAR|nr:MFS general substrate transporter [Roridomyces roridus]
MGFGSDKTPADHAAPPPPPQNVGFGKKLLYHLWDSDQHLKSPEERRLVRKLDFGILIVASLGWFMKYVDQANLSNAYVSGMKEDLNINANQYTIMQTTYLVGFAIMQLPSALIAMKIRPSWWLFVCEIGWIIFTFAQAGARSYQEMYFFRFMVGFFESAFSPVIIFLLGSWYSKAELAKRIAIWHLTGFVGQACSGFMQAAIYNNLDGKSGLAGWRWLYVICGIMSLPVAFTALFLLPDYPSNCKVWYITEEERQMALQRSANVGRVELSGVLTWEKFKPIFKSWRLYTLVVAYIWYGASCQANSYFGIYLKAMGYSVSQRNILPAAANLLSAATVFLYGFGSDITRNRFWWILCPLIFVQWPGNGILAIWPDNTKARMAAFYIISMEYMTCVYWTWANEICSGNPEARAVTIAAMNGFFYFFNAGIPNAIFLQTDGPSFRKGFPTTWAFGILAAIFVVLVQFLHNREVRLELQKKEAEVESGGKDSSVEDEKSAEVEVQVGEVVIPPSIPTLH